MTDLSSRTVAQLKEELQKKGVDVKGLKLKKDYVEKLQQVLDAEFGGAATDETPQVTQPEEVHDDSGLTATDAEEGKHVSSTEHDQAIQDPETVPQEAPPPISQTTEAEPDSVEGAKEDSSIAITKEDKNEQILGDVDGDLDQKMEAAAEAGKEERIEEQGDAAHQTETEKAAAEETKEEGNIAVEAAEAQPPQVVAQEQNTSDAVPETDSAMDQDPAKAEKRKRSEDDDEKDGKRARLSPATEQPDSKPDTAAEPVAMAASPKRPSSETEATHPLPDKLSHVSHPATRALYISNLKRPLLTPDLKAWLIEQGTADGVQEEDVLDVDALTGGVWLDGVKSHCYCIFKTIEIAIAAATRIQDQVFPVDHGVPLTVEFVPEDIVPSLVSQEKAAWENGRNKLALEITKGTGFGGSDYSFDLVPPKGKDGIRSSGGLGNLRPPRPTPGSRPPELAGPAAFNSAVGRPEFRPPPPSNGWGSRGGQANEAPGLQRTRTQPVLLYRESPKHAKAVPRFERDPHQQRDSGGFGFQPRHNAPQGNWGRSNDGPQEQWGRSNDRGWGRPSAGGW